MSLLRPVIADLALLKAIMFVVVVAIYAINHLLGALKKPPPGQPPRMPPPARPRPAEAPVPADNPDVNAELNEFLRRAAAKRQQGGGRSPQSAPAKPEPARIRKRKKPEPTTAPARPVEPRLTERRALPTLDTRAIEERSTQLDTSISGDQLGDHIREVFDRQLGLLASDSEKPPTATPSPNAELQTSIAVEMSALLRDPQSLRGAVILNEIFTRPQHRW